MPLRIVKSDITVMAVDAVVNAANDRLIRGGGVCGAIFAAAGAPELEHACAKIGRCEVGKAVITPGFALPAGHIIHTVGPVWQGGGNGEREKLASCYESALALAASKGMRSVAFPLISSGIYGYPKPEAIEVAERTILAFLEKHSMLVYLTFIDRETYDEAVKTLERIRAEKP